MMKLKAGEQGRSMVEMIGYMAVVMAVIVAVGKIVSNIFNEHRLSNASIQLSDLAVAISKAGAMEKDYSAVDLKKYIPSTYRVAGNKIIHVFGGEVKIGTSDSWGKDKFYITFDGLKRKQCIELAVKEWRRNRNVDLYAVGVNGIYSYWPVYKSVSEKNSLPITRAIAAGTSDSDNGLCNKDTDNTITWIFN